MVSHEEAASPHVTLLNEEILLSTKHIRSRVLCTKAVNVTNKADEKNLRRVVNYADSRVRCVKKPLLATPEEPNFADFHLSDSDIYHNKQCHITNKNSKNTQLAQP